MSPYFPDDFLSFQIPDFGPRNGPERDLFWKGTSEGPEFRLVRIEKCVTSEKRKQARSAEEEGFL